MSKKKKAAVAAPQQNEETLIQAAPMAEEILSTLDTPPAPGQADHTVETQIDAMSNVSDPYDLVQQQRLQRMRALAAQHPGMTFDEILAQVQAEIPPNLPPAPLQAQELTWENLSADQKAAVAQVQQILAPVESVLNDESTAKVFAQVGSTAVERLRKLRDEQTRARLIRKSGGKDASTRVQEMETAQQDLLEKRAAQILAANGKDKTAVFKMRPSQAWEQACAEQGKVTATFMAFEKRGAADRILQAAGLGNNYQPALPSAE